jgi:TPR repeat protein
MKCLLIFPVLLMIGCSQLVSEMSSVHDDSAQIKSRVMKVVQAQREKKDWMKADVCPVDKMPDEGRRPRIAAKDCAENPAKCLERCDANDGDSCYALAQLIQEHDTIENDVADVLYRHSCRLGVVSGCTNAASNLFESKHEPSVACGARTFEAACSKDDAWACTMNGLALGAGIGRAKNIVEANRSLDKACEVSVDKNGQACTKAKELKAAFARNEN